MTFKPKQRKQKQAGLISSFNRNSLVGPRSPYYSFGLSVGFE